MTQELSKLTAPNFQDLVINPWRGLVPPRIEIFVWISCLGKLNTRAKLAKLNIIPHAQDICPLCDKNSETVDHLLLHCEFSWKIWGWWFHIWNQAWVSPKTLKDLFISWSPENSNPFFKKIWWAMFYIIVWSVWKERNERVFRSSQCSHDQIRELILTRIGWWIKGWGDPFPYSIDDIIRNPVCLQWGPPKRLIQSSLVRMWYGPLHPLMPSSGMLMHHSIHHSIDPPSGEF